MAGRKSHYGANRTMILRLISATAKSHGAPPTVRELASMLGVGVATMHLYLNRLGDEGLLVREPGRHRSLRVTDAGRDVLGA